MRSSRGERVSGSGFLAVDRGALVRLAVALLLGACALVVPQVAQTGAEFTDSVDLPATFRTATSFDPPPASDPTDGPTAGPTAGSSPTP